LNLNDLRDRLDSFSPGDWFALYDDEIGWKGPKLRPCMLIESYGNHPISSIRPRTTTGRDGRFHSAHPYRHQPRCQIDRAGKIPEVLLRVSTGLINSQNYRCSEPDRAFLDSILPDHLK